ncbi:hypothetical protein [Actinoplanes sp. HUAS TT8]|uniref:hypothetical protein n=1 Tax=Actinoplanes sp. HUAS TT8 TaxID=3447453 RepID=UPI003F51BA29
MTGDWAPILYGRTRYADMWWRVLPPGETDRGTLAGLVLATVGGGDALDLRPRFVLARGDFGVLAGVACDAAEVSDTMATQARRPLYTFVGWLGPAGARVPAYATWERRWREWARPTYDRLMRVDWDLPEHEVTGPRTAEPEQFAGYVGDEPGSPDETWRPAVPGAIWLLPEAQAAGAWDAARDAPGPFCLCTGWAWGQGTAPGRITHLCSQDVRETRLSRARPAPLTTAPTTPVASEVAPAADKAPDRMWLCRQAAAIKRLVWRKPAAAEPTRDRPPATSHYDRPSGPIVPPTGPGTRRRESRAIDDDLDDLFGTD